VELKDFTPSVTVEVFEAVVGDIDDATESGIDGG